MVQPLDPPVWLGGAILAAGLATVLALRLWPSAQPDGLVMGLRRVLAGGFALAAAAGLGMAAAQLRTLSVAQAPLPVSADAVAVRGWVVGVDSGERGPRLRLLVRDIAGAPTPPRYVRIAVPTAGALTPGRAAWCRAELSQPTGPMTPGAYDFARRAYFERLGATGFGYGRCRPDNVGPPPGWLDRQRLKLAALQSDLAAAIVEAAPGRGGAIAAALVTGDRSAIDKDTNVALRDSGLGHLLSVSGVHMGIVGGLVFAVLLWTFSILSPIALRFPVKKIAAVGALVVLAVYLVVSGSSVPALRSYVMAGVAFGAILLDRPAISMRGLALATLIVVMLFPESVIEPGFQMSFAATVALVALFEVLKRSPEDRALPTPGLLIGAMQWAARGVGGVMLISFVAGIATDPFAIYHFQRFSIYSLVANLIVEPIISFLVAPAAVCAAVLAPFGYAEVPLQVMASALDLVAAVGDVFGSRPEAVRALPRPPDEAFLLCVAALLWACLWRGHLRWGGVAFLAASIWIYARAPQPVVAFDAELRAVYARDQSGAWTLAPGRGRSTYARDRLGAMLGISPAAIERLAPPEACSDAICTWRSARGQRFALVRSAEGLDAACREGALVIAAAAAPPAFAARCRATVIDAAEVARLGGGFIYETPDGPRIARARSGEEHRPWTPAIRSEEAQE
ncbi:ComEC/Rec2 family competence protein [Terricaulis sp.]|uniref:ComEC/Rec2 family competence protein n=1 Tax=Terricaulis sp. TaxID=2768686 RepID=UPI0037830BF9